jgi:lipopolysaccharide transport system ATP-binding protein
MRDVAIIVEGLSKRYRLGTAASNRAGYKTFREAIAQTGNRLLRRSRWRTTPAEPFWALKDVSFEVKRGEVVGIIGRNGAGKSTLLKILSRITEPTEGGADIHGRVGSLLEVGTGFHPELSGRENVYLNGAILGMRRAEIAKKFDEIVAFAEIEKFIDTPVKHYSSGMYMRLAFAVAAHLDPEILVVDEVLAVGDAKFQQKCLGRMNDIATTGRTVLFVSHNLAALRSICRGGVLLDRGRCVETGRINDVVGSYLASQANGGLKVRFEETPGRDADASLTGVVLQDRQGRDVNAIQFGDDAVLAITYRLNKRIPDCRVGFDVVTDNGTMLSVATTEDRGAVVLPDAAGDYTVRATIPGGTLGPGTYSVGICLDQPPVRVLDDRPNALEVSVTGNPLPRGRRWDGIIDLSPKWAVEEMVHCPS